MGYYHHSSILLVFIPVYYCHHSSLSLLSFQYIFAYSSISYLPHGWFLKSAIVNSCSILNQGLHSTYSSPTVHLQSTYSSPTVHLQSTYSSPTVHLQFTYSSPTVHLQFTYNMQLYEQIGVGVDLTCQHVQLSSFSSS